jgi:uncharacterized protein YchJ
VFKRCLMCGKSPQFLCPRGDLNTQAREPHHGPDWAAKPEQLMRSRYSAGCHPALLAQVMLSNREFRADG